MQDHKSKIELAPELWRLMEFAQCHCVQILSPRESLFELHQGSAHGMQHGSRCPNHIWQCSVAHMQDHKSKIAFDHVRWGLMDFAQCHCVWILSPRESLFELLQESTNGFQHGSRCSIEV